MTPLDLAGLVLIASRTLDLDEESVLGSADLDAADSILAVAEGCRGDPVQQAAMLLVGLVRRRVFGPRSAEVAVMAAVQLLTLNGQEVDDLGSPAPADDWTEGGMFERFTNRARNVVKLAQEEARRLDYDHIGTEHVLLGLLAEPESIGAKRRCAAGRRGGRPRGGVARGIRR